MKDEFLGGRKGIAFQKGLWAALFLGANEGAHIGYESECYG